MVAAFASLQRHRYRAAATVRVAERRESFRFVRSDCRVPICLHFDLACALGDFLIHDDAFA